MHIPSPDRIHSRRCFLTGFLADLLPRFLLTGVVLAAASGCSSKPAAEIDPQLGVTGPGSYGVGQTVTAVTYQPEGLDETRELRLVVWYPTLQTDGPRRQWGQAIVDASVAPDGKFPVLVTSHGTSSFAETSYRLIEHFASHGFVAAAPDHTGDVTANFGDPRTTEMYFLRPMDVSAVIDHLYALPSGDPLSGRLTDDLVLAGHSYGGFTSLASAGASFSEEAIAECDDGVENSFCSTMTPAYADLLRAGFKDDRVKAVIPMAAGNSYELGPGGVQDVDIPVMLMSASMDDRCPNDTQGDPYWENITHPDSIRVDLERGGHHSYILTCELTPFLGDANGGGCGDQYLDFETALTITNAYALSFARYHLFGDAEMTPILQGQSPIWDGVTLSYK